MTSYKSDLLNRLQSHGHIHQCTNMEGLDAIASKKIITGYIGFDATADSLHIGNLAGIMMLRRLQQAGHKPLVIMGGGTTKIGDPSGKTETRQILSNDAIQDNINNIEKTFRNFLTFGNGASDAVIINNDDWLSGLEYIPFLREVGSHFTINRMLTFDSVKMRLDREQPLTFLEFNYMILQAYDFAELYKRHKCVLQMGGSDQWGNIVNGVELGRRLYDAELFGLTCPLITKSDGSKMGKSVSGAIWLNPNRLSPYDYWQFWRNTDDADVARFMRIFTDIDLSEIARIEKLQGAELNDAKKHLAFEATKLCHGDGEAQKASDTAASVFGGGGGSERVIDYPHTSPPFVFDIIMHCNLATSKGEAKRLIEQNAVRMNDKPVTEITATITHFDLDTHACARLSVGKKHHVKVRFNIGPPPTR